MFSKAVGALWQPQGHLTVTGRPLSCAASNDSLTYQCSIAT